MTNKQRKVENIQRMYMNSYKITAFQIWELEDHCWHLIENTYIDGWFKRENTLLRKFDERKSLTPDMW